MRKKLFTIKVVECWPRLPREVADAPIPGDIPDQAGRGSEQPELVKMSLLMAGGALGELGRSLQPKLFHESMFWHW